jgi:hypothetical protein
LLAVELPHLPGDEITNMGNRSKLKTATTKAKNSFASPAEFKEIYKEVVAIATLPPPNYFTHHRAM